MDNNIKTVFFLSALTGLLVFAGFFLGGELGAVIALFFAGAINFFSYWFSDRIVLAMYGAQELKESEAQNIHAMVERLAKNAGIPKPRIFLAPINQPNAFATGRDPKHGVICFTYGILQALDKEELEGVTAHELGHIKNRDILIVSIVATLAGALALIARFAFYFGFLFSGRDKNNFAGSILGFLFFVLVTPIIAVMLQLAVSRSREYLADSTGARIAGSGQGLARGLLKLEQYAAKIPLDGGASNRATAHLFIVNPFEKGFFTTIFSTHPPVQKRVEKLNALAPR
ncbi:MAG: zinc metalloprotease HtpX [Candidatus Diapherotrites archaeon]|nr:zinc metalloprotease HtpX [Candidatus Diapherotrites archaeon]